MINLLGFIYDLAKDIKGCLAWDEEEKLVDFNWPRKSGLAAKAETKGMKLAWCRSDNIASWQFDGYEIVYEVDKINCVRRKLVLRDGLILVGKRPNS